MTKRGGRESGTASGGEQGAAEYVPENNPSVRQEAAANPAAPFTKAEVARIRFQHVAKLHERIRALEMDLLAAEKHRDEFQEVTQRLERELLHEQRWVTELRGAERTCKAANESQRKHILTLTSDVFRLIARAEKAEAAFRAEHEMQERGAKALVDVIRKRDALKDNNERLRIGIFALEAAIEAAIPLKRRSRSDPDDREGC